MGIERARSAGLYGALVLTVIAVALLGFAGFLLIARVDLLAGTGVGLLVLAAGAGTASFFSPCSFGLLIAILAHPAAESVDGRSSTSTLVSALALSVGAVSFLALFGTAVAAASAAFFADIDFTSLGGRLLRIAVGVILIALGLVQLNRLRLSLRRFEPATHAFLHRQVVLARRRPFVGYALFGFGYVLAGFG